MDEQDRQRLEQQYQAHIKKIEQEKRDEARQRGISVEELERQRKAERAEKARLEAEREAQSRPCYGMDRAAVKSWMKKHAEPGLIVVIRDTMFNDYRYSLDVIDEVKASAGRFYTQSPHSYKGGAGFYFSGQSTKDPKGQVDVLIPTPPLVDAAAKDPTSKPYLEAAEQQTKRLFSGSS